MTVHVLHAGDGYVYLTRSVAAHDSRLRPSESLADYYVANGQPPGRWSGSGATRLRVSGTVTEDQMRLLFGEGCHPNADRVAALLRQQGASDDEVDRAVRLGRRFPRYRRRPDLSALVQHAYTEREQTLGRPLGDAEKLHVRQHALAGEFKRQHGRAPLDPIELDEFAASSASDGREAVAGYDLVFTPVKSVTTLWGIASESTRRAIFAAHAAAVTDALGWLERNAAFTRAGKEGQAQIDTHGVIAACFDHWDSRAGDPDLHTHVAVSNKVHGVDGVWRSLDGRAIFAVAVSLSERYNTRIEDELRARLGVEFAPSPRSDDGNGRRPVREIVGFPDELIEVFSKRRHGIEQIYHSLVGSYRETHGRLPDKQARWRLYQQATLQERPDKQPGHSLGSLIAGWRREADQMLGQADAHLGIERMVLGRGHRAAIPSPVDLAEAVVAAVSENRSTWTVHHVRAEAHRQSRPYATVDRDGYVEAIVAAATAPGRVVRIETPRVMAEPDELRRASGESVFEEHAATRYTTIAILDAEERIVTAARLQTGHGLTTTAADSALAQDPRLNPQQRSLVRAFVCTRRLLMLGIAPAGAGKTAAMRVAVLAWGSSERPVVALAPSASAAAVLHAELGVPADTLAKFDHDRPPIRPGTLILVDEAGLSGTMLLDRLVTRAAEADAVVRLLGDDRQLAAVEAGGVLRHLAHEVGAVRMQQVVRFADPDEAAATVQIRDGDPHAVEFYLRAGRITAGTNETIPDVAYEAWLTDMHAGRDSVLLAAAGATVSALNARARADLIAAGAVDVDGVSLRDGNAAGVGDRIVTRRNHRRLIVHGGRDWVKNGDSWRVVATHADGSLTAVHRLHGGRVTLPVEYVAYQVELDYARTIRRAQGMTVDRAHLLVDPGMAREDLYVGVSRARLGTHLYVAVATDPGPAHPPEVAGSTRDVLAAIIRHSGVEPSALEAVKTAIDGAGDLRRMAVEYDYALSVRTGDAFRVAAEAVHPGISADTAWPHLAHRLHLAEGVGMAPGEALRRARQLGDFTAARSTTAVMTHRLDLILARAGALDTSSPVPWWLAAPPPPGHAEPWRAYLPARYQEMAARIDDLAGQARHDRPPWLPALGPTSTHRDHALRQVVSYRSVYDIHADDPLGPEPGRPGRQQQAWRACRDAIRTAQDTPSPTNAERLLAALDDTERHTAYDSTGPARPGPTLHI